MEFDGILRLKKIKDDQWHATFITSSVKDDVNAGDEELKANGHTAREAFDHLVEQLRAKL